MGLRGYEDFHPEGAKILSIRPTAPPTPAPEPIKISKYHNVRKKYNGVIYDSTAEADYAEKLDGEKQFSPGMFWVRQVVFHLGCPENKYRCDFLVSRPGIPTYAIDVKGCDTAQFLKNVKLWRAYGPCRLCIIRRSGKGWTCEIIHGGGDQS